MIRAPWHVRTRRSKPFVAPFRRANSFGKWVLKIVLLASLVWTATFPILPSADAQGLRRAGTVRLEAAPGRKGLVDLRFTQEGFVGEFGVVNDGREPLVVSRVAVRSDDPRVTTKLDLRVKDGPLPVTIAPGASRKVVVQWIPEREARLKQLFAHVVVTTSDERSGEVAIGVRAQIPGWLGPLEGYALSLLVGVPLLGVVLLLVVGKRGERDPRLYRRVAVAALGAQGLLAAYVFFAFRAAASRLDGNDGLQFVEHGVWIRSLSVELFFAVDGVSVATIAVVSFVAWFALLPVRSHRCWADEGMGYYAAYLTLASSVAGALAAMDALLFVLFTAVATFSSVLLLGGFASASRRAAAAKLSLLGTIAVVALLVAVIALARHADPTFLVDGTKTSTTFSLPELARVVFGAKEATLLGGSLIKASFVLVLVASLILLGAFPFYAWLSPALTEGSAATGALISAALPAIGGCALLRIGCLVLPEGMRWASGVVVALGAVTAICGALSALGQSNLRRLAAAGTMTQIGFFLLGAGSLTPQGLSAAIVIGATRALACGLFITLAGAIEERARTADLRRLAGIATQVPVWTGAVAIVAFAQAGIMGVGGAWGPMLALLGALPNYPPLALSGGVALVISAVAHLLPVSRLVFGKFEQSWQTSPWLEPFGGRFPDLTAREWLSIFPAVTLIVLLGVWPAPLFASTASVVRDLTHAVSPPTTDSIGGL